MRINEIDLPFSSTKPACLRRLEQARARVRAQLAQLRQQRDDRAGMAALIEMMEASCAAVTGFFDEVWGEGTANALFGPEVDLDECVLAFRECGRQVAEDQRRRAERWAQYLPEDIDWPQGPEAMEEAGAGKTGGIAAARCGKNRAAAGAKRGAAQAGGAGRAAAGQSRAAKAAHPDVQSQTAKAAHPDGQSDAVLRKTAKSAVAAAPGKAAKSGGAAP